MNKEKFLEELKMIIINMRIEFELKKGENYYKLYDLIAEYEKEGEKV